VGPALQKGGAIDTVDNLHVIDETCDVVIECIAEDISQKVSLFVQLNGAAHRDAIFISTTSGLSITEMGRLSGIEHLLVGAHFWNPAHLMPLVEVICGASTPVQVLDTTCELVRSIGKTPVRVNRDVPGFIGNRLLHAMWREAIYLVQTEVASAADIDLVARLTFGLRAPAMGPLENMDIVGLDLVHTIHDYLLADLADDHQPLSALKEKVRKGQLGVKSTQGFYDWQKRDARELLRRRDRQIITQLDLLSQ